MMERLTWRIGKTVYYAQGKYYKETLACECDADDVRNILQKLADYEDLNATPLEIKNAFNEIENNQKQMQEHLDEMKEMLFKAAMGKTKDTE